MILLDTNVLVYATNAEARHHVASRRVVDAVITRRIAGCIVPQVLIEYVGATTGPGMQLPLPADAAVEQARIFKVQIPVLGIPATALDELWSIVAETGRAGRRIFDYFLAAQARAHGIRVVCTYNVEDFANVSGVRALTPEEIQIPAD